MIMKILTLIAIALVAVQSQTTWYNTKYVANPTQFKVFDRGSKTNNLNLMKTNSASVNNVDYLTSSGEFAPYTSPLHSAIDNGNPDMVRFLVRDMNASLSNVCEPLDDYDHCSYSPLTFAKKQVQRVTALFGGQSEQSKNANKIVDILEDEAESRNPTCPSED